MEQPKTTLKKSNFSLWRRYFLQGLSLLRFYVNSWGRDKTQIKWVVSERIGPARFSCMAEQDSFPEIGEIPHAKADALQNLCFVVAAFNEAI